MTLEQLIITVTTPDRPGVIRAVSQTVREHAGNWTESSFTALEGIFVGIVKIEVSTQQKSELIAALNELSNQAINIQYPEKRQHDGTKRSTDSLILKLEANDREGIIEEITTTLAAENINIIDLQSRCESASMAGYNLFCAEITVSLPANTSRETLVGALEHISDDVMVSLDENVET